MKQKEYSKQLINIYNQLPENFYHENLESILELSVLLKYLDENKLIQYMPKLKCFIDNLQNSFDVYGNSLENHFGLQDLSIAITNINNLLIEIREDLSLLSNKNKKSR